MKQHPILFSAPMVCAILNGSKTQTRRILIPQPRSAPIKELDGVWNDCGGFEDRDSLGVMRIDVRPVKVKYAVGDQFWVRESWTTRQALDNTKPSEISQNQSIGYIADDEGPWLGKKRPSIFMCRWMSRITLTVTDVRVQRLRDISEQDAIAEGIELDLQCCGNHETEYDLSDHGEPINMREGPCCGNPTLETDPRQTFEILWDSINAKRAPWESNPWVVAYTFEEATE